MNPKYYERIKKAYNKKQTSIQGHVEKQQAKDEDGEIKK